MTRRFYNWIKRKAASIYYRSPAPVVKRGESHAELLLQGYYSQWGQDKWVIERYFPGKTDGVFVDIGAHDGITFSNTFALERMGWTGMAVEPIPSVFEQLKTNRHCITIQGCVAGESGIKQFREITGYAQMLSGMVDLYDSRHVDRINNEILEYGGEFRDIEVECFNINELMTKYALDEIDYLNLDVEGAEYQILKSIDFSKTQIHVIGVENNYKDEEILRLLFKRGFIRDSILGDEFYLNKGDYRIKQKSR
jgi:FkbM family methyltransferase